MVFSEANNDHHAFGWFANRELLSVPTARYFSERWDADEDGYEEAYRYVREDELSILHVGIDENGMEGIQAQGRVAHNAEVQYSDDLMRSAFDAHPSFFRDRNYGRYYEQHCEQLETMLSRAESEGHRFRSVTPSEIPALKRRQQ